MKTPTEDTPVSERKWTKGPWVVGTDTFDNDGYSESVIAQKDGPLAVAFAIEVDVKNVDVRKHNARLIAAAPDLYEALSELLPFAQQAYVGGPDADALLAKARAALQRAEGEL